MEIYSSGGDVNLELPTGELEAVKELWQIQPFETKAVIRANFRASVQRNHTCYLRIRLNGTADHLVVPFEVEVGSSAGLYPPEPIIDLGTIGSEFTPQRFAISLLNSGKKTAIIEVRQVVETFWMDGSCRVFRMFTRYQQQTPLKLKSRAQKSQLTLKRQPELLPSHFIVSYNDFLELVFE